MRAVAFHEHGPRSVLQLSEQPDPAVGAREVRVRVRACALNRLDLFVRKGWKGLELPLPHILGSDVSGEIESVGAEVRGLSVGQPVLVGPGLADEADPAVLRGEDNRGRSYRIIGEHAPGGYAELLTVPAKNCFSKPSNLSFEEAACLPLVFTTAWGMLVERANLMAGEWVLIHAAGSGVGSAAIQIAKHLGATVITTAGSRDKLDRAAELGADHLINYKEEDFVERVKAITNRRGVSLVFEHVGGETFEKSIHTLSVGGRLVTCGASDRPIVSIDIRRLFARHITLIGNTMGSLAAMIPIVENAEKGIFKPVLDTALPLREAARAHEMLETRAQFGKVVLVP